MNCWIKAAHSRHELYRRLSDAFMIIPAAIFAVVLGLCAASLAQNLGRVDGDFDSDDLFERGWIGESNISRGDWRFSRGLLLVHGGFLALSLLALWYRRNSRLSSFSLLGLLKKTQD